MPMIRRRRPVLRAAGAAAVGGAAYHAGKRSAEGSSPREPVQAAYPPPSDLQSGGDPQPGGGLTSDTIEQLSELGRLHEQGILTDEEFEEQKRRYLQAG